MIQVLHRHADDWSPLRQSDRLHGDRLTYSRRTSSRYGRRAAGHLHAARWHNKDRLAHWDLCRSWGHIGRAHARVGVVCIARGASAIRAECDADPRDRRNSEEGAQSIEEASHAAWTGLWVLAAPLIHGGSAPEGDADMRGAEGQGTRITCAKQRISSRGLCQPSNDGVTADQSQDSSRKSNVAAILNREQREQRVEAIEYELHDDLAAHLSHYVRIVRVAHVRTTHAGCWPVASTTGGTVRSLGLVMFQTTVSSFGQNSLSKRSPSNPYAK